MSNLLEELVTYLVGQSLVTADGADAFRDYLPDSPDSVVVLYEDAGVPSNVFNVSGRFLQILCRNTSYGAARAKSWAVFNALNKEDPIQFLNATRWVLLDAEQTPYKLKVDASGRTIFSCNFAIVTYND